MWEFDSPRLYIDLFAEIQTLERLERSSDLSSVIIDPWFLDFHQNHERVRADNTSPTVAVLKRPTSLSRVPLRVNSDDIESSSKSYSGGSSSTIAQPGIIKRNTKNPKPNESISLKSNELKISKSIAKEVLNQDKLRDKLDTYKLTKKRSQDKVKESNPKRSLPCTALTNRTAINDKNRMPNKCKAVSRIKEEEDMLLLLKKHNERFAAASTYEPSRHAVRDVRQWERETGKCWANLKADEREKANEEISQMKLKEN